MSTVQGATIPPVRANPTTTTVASPAGTTATRSAPSGGFFSRSELGRVLWRFRREFGWVALFSFFANVLMLTPTLYMLQLFDRVLVSGSELTLLGLTLITVSFFLVMGFAEWLRSRLLVRSGAAFDEALNRRTFDAAFAQNLRQGGRLSLQPFNDLTAVRQFLSGSGPFAFFDLPWTVIYIAVLYVMHPWLGHASVFFCLLMLAMALWSNHLVSRQQEPVQQAGLETSSYLQSKMRNAETVEALGMLGNLRRLWQLLHERESARQADAYELSQRLQALTKFVQYSQQSLMLALGGLLAIDGRIGVGAMVAANALSGNAVRPIGTLVSVWKQFVDARQGYRRLETLLDTFPEAGPEADHDPIQGQITLRGLTATARGRNKPILDGLNAEFRAGEVVAILGPSGAGKSTLARCLLGIWPDTSGEVLLDGLPLSARSRDALGPQLGYLPQDIELFDGSIAENIARFGEVDAEQVIAAATRTGIHDMILRLSKGYDTPMGDAGGLLSGGQRQRIGLARALYGDPALVVLDEPNASLDEAGEAALVRAVRDLKASGKTVFMIVHARHLLVVADRVLVLDDGHIKALGVLQPPNPQNPLSPIEVRV
ncbi:MAG: type I secretion system permease/ATPase [Rubrivivax sp.]|nr:type I secretion system permease/ATPase [Rubrivivax sp.]